MAEIIQFPFKHGRDFHQSLLVMTVLDEMGFDDLEPDRKNRVAVGVFKQLDTLTDTQLAHTMRKYDPRILRESPGGVDTAS